MATISRFGDVLGTGNAEFDGEIRGYGLNISGDGSIHGALTVDGSLAVSSLSTESLGLSGCAPCPA